MNTIYFLNIVAESLFGAGDNNALPESFYIGLSTSTPTVNGENVNEPASSAGYYRVSLGELSEPINGVVTNAENISFRESTSSWGTVTHFVIYDAEVGGNLLMFGALSTPRVVEEATVFTIRQGYLRLSAQNPS